MLLYAFMVVLNCFGGKAPSMVPPKQKLAERLCTLWNHALISRHSTAGVSQKTEAATPRSQRSNWFEERLEPIKHQASAFAGRAQTFGASGVWWVVMTKRSISCVVRFLLQGHIYVDAYVYYT